MSKRLRAKQRAKNWNQMEIFSNPSLKYHIRTLTVNLWQTRSRRNGRWASTAQHTQCARALQTQQPVGSCAVISKLLRPGFRQQGNLRGSRVLHNSAALPKAFALCHSSEFSKVKEAGGEQRKEQTEWKQHSNSVAFLPSHRFHQGGILREIIMFMCLASSREQNKWNIFYIHFKRFDRAAKWATEVLFTQIDV